MLLKEKLFLNSLALKKANNNKQVIPDFLCLFRVTVRKSYLTLNIAIGIPLKKIQSVRHLNFTYHLLDVTVILDA